MEANLQKILDALDKSTKEEKRSFFNQWNSYIEDARSLTASEISTMETEYENKIKTSVNNILSVTVPSDYTVNYVKGLYDTWVSNNKSALLEFIGDDTKLANLKNYLISKAENKGGAPLDYLVELLGILKKYKDVV